jgi:hypothetical protein
MPTHHQTLARLDLLVSEACDLCNRAEDVQPGNPEAAVPVAFQTVLGREVRDWMHRADNMVRTVKPDGDRVCGQRASELRRLIDTANVAMMKRPESRQSWVSFYRLAHPPKG